MTVTPEILHGRAAKQQAHVAALHRAARISDDEFFDITGKIGDQLAADLAQLDAPAPERKRTPKSQLPAPAATPFYAQASEALYADRRMKDSARRLVLILVRLARGRGSCDAYVDQLADMMGVTGRTVQYAQRRAEECGFLRVEHVREGRINDANVYHLFAPCFPQGRPEPRKRTKRSTRPPRRQRPMGVKNFSPHEERSSNDELPPCNPPEGDLKGEPLVAAQVVWPIVPGSIGAAAAKLLGRDEGSKIMPATGPP